MKQSKNNLYKEYDTVKYDVFLSIFYKITNLNTNTQNNSENNPLTKILQFANNHWRRDMESSTTRSQKSRIRVRSLNTSESSLKLTLKTHPLADKHRITSAERSIHIETITSSTSQKDLGQTRTNNTLKIHPLSINTSPWTHFHRGHFNRKLTFPPACRALLSLYGCTRVSFPIRANEQTNSRARHQPFVSIFLFVQSAWCCAIEEFNVFIVESANLVSKSA